MEAGTLTLSARLHAVADAVPPGVRVADVGTDHAQLLAWLRGHGRATLGIGIDVAPGPLEQARRTLAQAGVDGVELRRGDGLAALRPGEVDVVVLAGMGGAKMVRLLDASPAVVEGLEALVLQPNTEWSAVRRWVAARRLRLASEAMVEDRGKHYVVMVARPRAGDDPGWSEDELELGPRLLVERPPAFVAWLRHELLRNERALAAAIGGRGPADPRLGARPDSRPDSRLTALHERVARLRRALGVG